MYTRSQFYICLEELSFPSWWSSIENMTVWDAIALPHFSLKQFTRFRSLGTKGFLGTIELPRELTSLKILGWPIDFAYIYSCGVPTLSSFTLYTPNGSYTRGTLRFLNIFKIWKISHWRMRPWGSAIHCVTISNSLLFARSPGIAPLAKGIIGNSQVEG